MNKEDRSKALHAACDEFAKKLTDEGRLIEAGWEIMRTMVLPPNVPTVQTTEMRKAFFMGAQHLFASIMGIMDADREPTESDMARMYLIYNELEAFRKEVTSFHSAGRG